ncbi:hypothetical protein GCM10009092_35520 [Bowmanella denitrificans]|uniref:Protein-tyrosine-phosphatase n=1 Tax=Bowmanella denitrificans TaxID=366582 RepID=A0ABP3HHI8_9ALTE
MKNTSLLMAGLLTVSLAGCTQTPVSLSDLETNFSEQQYQLSWQPQPGDAEVDILVSQYPDAGKARLLAKDVKAHQYAWTPEDAHQRYYFFVKPEGGEPVMTANRLMPLEGGRNFRDLGGYQTQDGRTVRWGKIYRSGVLANLTEADYAFVDSLGIETVVDFRANSERQSESTQWRAAEVEIISTDYEMDFDMGELGKILRSPDLSRDKLEAMMAQMYPHILEDQKQNYRAMFDRLVDKDGGLLFHCTAGKDRTGISAALVLSALGVDRQTVIQDYLATNQYLDFQSLIPKDSSNMDPKYAAMMKFFASLPQDITQPLMGVTQPLIESAIAAMEAKHGSVLEYLKQELDVSEQDIQILRAKYLL